MGGRDWSPSGLVDRAEEMRREGGLQDALESVEQFLEPTPNHSRALLLRSRLLYELGRGVESLFALRELEEVLGEHEELQLLLETLEQICKRRNASIAPAFATESMARLLAQQSYFLEAMEIYRRLYLAAPERRDLRDELVRLSGRLEQDGSRGAAPDKVARELEAWNRWFKEQQREF